ncbi:hypothetical protein [Clostridium paraputrificum]|nr:hypothetical protein [Clostridium paraputrificum]
MKNNKLSELDMDKVNTVISILKIDNNSKRGNENIIFEWNNDYI